MTDMATVLRHDGAVGLRYERRLRQAPEKVWAALTESEHLAQWMPCDLVGERRAGAAISLPFWPAIVEKHGIEDPVLAGEIRVWSPPSVFEWTWETDVLRWELSPTDDGGTLLVLTTWLGDAGAPPAGTAAGYHVCLDHLQQLLDTGSAPPIATADPSALERRYAEVAGL